MAAFPYVGGTTCGTGDTAAQVIIVIDESATQCSSNLPWPPARSPEDPDDAELKAVTRELRRAESLQAVRGLHYCHELEPCTHNTRSGAARAPRPTRRRTATAVRNFRRTP